MCKQFRYRIARFSRKNVLLLNDYIHTDIKERPRRRRRVGEKQKKYRKLMAEIGVPKSAHADQGAHRRRK